MNLFSRESLGIEWMMKEFAGNEGTMKGLGMEDIFLLLDGE